MGRDSCLSCGADMSAKRSHAVYCSRTCKTKASDTRRVLDGRSVARDRARYQNEAEHRREYARQYHYTHAEAVRVLSIKKRAARRNAAAIFEVTARDWRRLLARFRGRSAYCGGADNITCDHVIPLSRGGVHSIGNILPACRSCNEGKRTRTLVEWRMARG